MKNKEKSIYFVFLTIFFTISFFTALNLCHAITDEEVMASAKKQGHYHQLEQHGKYQELVDAYLNELKSDKERGRLFQQMDILVKICRICFENLKNYSLAISYGEEALQLAKKGIATGPENEPDDNFWPLLSSQIREKEGPEYMKREKIYLYHLWKNQINGLLFDGYKAVRDAPKAAFYEREWSDSESQKLLDKLLKEGREEYRKKLEKQEAILKEKGIKSGYTAEDYDVLLRKVEKKDHQLERFEELMNKQAATGNVEGLRKTLFSHPDLVSLKEDMTIYDEGGEPEERPLGKKLSQAEHSQVGDRAYKYLLGSYLAYKYNLYREAFRFSIRSLINSLWAIEGHVQLDSKYLKPPYFWDEFYGKMQMECRLRAGLSLNRLGRYPDAIRFLKKVYEERNAFHELYYLQLDMWDSRSLALYELAQAYENTGQREKAIKAYGETLDYIEGIRAKLTTESHKIGFMTAQREIYDKIIKFLIQEGRIVEAFEYAERAKARAFLDLLAEKELRPRTKKVEPLLAKKQSLDKELYHITEGPGRGMSKERSAQTVLKERGEVIKEIERHDPEFASLITVKPSSVHEIQSFLDKDTCLLEYYIDKDGINIWVVTDKKVNARRVEIPISLLVRKVAEFRESLIRPDELKKRWGRSLREGASRISLEITPTQIKKGDKYQYRVYVENRLPLFLSIDEMIIKIGDWENHIKDVLEKEVPEGQRKLIYEKTDTWGVTQGAHQVILKTDQGVLASNILEVTIDPSGNFTLKDRGAIQKKYASKDEEYMKSSLYDLIIKPMEPYLKRGRIGVIPHSILHYIPFAALNYNHRLLIEDHTVFQLPSASIMKFCRNKKKEVRAKLLAIGNPDLNNPHLDLAASMVEVEKIGKLYPGSKVLTRSFADKTTFKENARSYEILHLACHAVFNADQPLDSALLLSPSRYDDGRLTANEIFDLDLKSSLVTLSACQSGLSRIRAGDEMMGLPRAFIYAGSPSIVASLWNVNDEATAILMERFYRNLQNKEKDEALRDSQLFLMRDPRFDHPYFWAAFVLIGDYK